MLKDKVMLVTGGSQGIGAGICKYAAEQGAKVAVNYQICKETAETVKYECNQFTMGSEVFQADLEYPEQALHLIEKVWGHYGRIDILVHNAAICPFKPFIDITSEDWYKTFNVNLNSGFFMAQDTAKRMIKAGLEGRIIFISSVLSEISAPTQVHYSTTKAAIKMLTKGMARELGSHGITVNAVGPAAVETEMSRADWERPEAKDILPWLVPVGRLGLPKDVAAAVSFLASDQASFITGQSLYVDGGLLTSKK